MSGPRLKRRKAADLIKRDFKAEHFGEKWSTDMTEIKMEKRKVYLTIVIDNFNSEVVGYSITDKPELASVLTAIGFARREFENVTPVVHSDRDWDDNPAEQSIIYIFSGNQADPCRAYAGRVYFAGKG